MRIVTRVNFGRVLRLGAVAATLIPFMASAETTAASSSPIVNRSIGYILTQQVLGHNVAANGNADCPNGFNDGPREQFNVLFPEGTKRTVADTLLKREAEVWWPEQGAEPANLPYKEPIGKETYGLNLDGKVDANDYTSPDFKDEGVDNALYAATGCVSFWREPDGVFFYGDAVKQNNHYRKILIEITELDDIQNDPEVVVKTYQAKDPYIRDASAGFLPRGSNRVNENGKMFQQTFKGSIVNGVLVTEPQPWLYAEGTHANYGFLKINDARFKLKLDTEGGEGVFAGHMDVEQFYRNFVTGWSTHHLGYGQLAAASMYRALYRHADAYPNAKGQNTAISAAYRVKMVQVFIQRGADGAVTAQAPLAKETKTAASR